MRTHIFPGAAPGFGKTVVFAHMLLAGVLGNSNRKPRTDQLPAFPRNNLSSAVCKAIGRP
ncbi:hypothetical protein [Pseudomonas aeruginosa]|jgi:hypothetical protein|uniref:hypothetical protein n=1 Tax=Pseudomonas aeruginosa TaxID=287 RepID=UPI003523B94B